MKAALLMGPNDIQIKEVEMTEPGPGEVRLKVAAAGICGTDVEAYKGNPPEAWNVTYPFQMGHEFSAVVDAVGEGVETFKPGDRVAVDGRVPCFMCSQCRAGHFNACLNMGYISGGFREYSVFPVRNLIKMPDGISFEEAAFAEPLSCCLYGNNKLDVNVGDFAVVIGEGAIGLLHAQILKSQGAEVAVTGLMPERLEIARQLGIDHVLNAREVDVEEEINRLSDGKGANQVICAAGAEIVIKQAIRMAARYGQVLYFAANMKDSVSLKTDDVHYKELKLIGSFDSTIDYFEMALRVVEKGKVDVKTLLSHKLPLEKATEAFEAAKNMEGMKIMLVNEV